MVSRTAVWWKNSLIGREEHLVPLLKASIIAQSEGYEWEGSLLSYQPKTTVLNVKLVNPTDSTFMLRNASEYRLHNQTDTFLLPAHGSLLLQVKVLKKLSEVALKLEVLNAIVAPGKHAFLELTVNGKADNPAALPKHRDP